jgi:hypothetical protein
VPDELRTFLDILRELALHKGFELLVVIKVNTVPKLRLTLVEVVY